MKSRIYWRFFSRAVIGKAKHFAKHSCINNFGFWDTLALTPHLRRSRRGKQAAGSHRMGEGESSSVGRRIQPLWKLRETGLALPSPVRRERVRVRVVLLEIRNGETSSVACVSSPDHLRGMDWRVALLPLAGPSF